MLFNYGATFCIIAVCCSGVAARPGSVAPRVFSNTTSSSSTTASSSLTSRTIPSLSSMDSTTSSGSLSAMTSVSSSSTTSSISVSDRLLAVTPTVSGPASTTSPTSTMTSTRERSTSTQSLSSSNTSSPTTSSSTTSFSATSGKNSSTTSTTSSTPRRSIISTTTSSKTSTTSVSVTSNSTSIIQTTCQPTTRTSSGTLCISYCGIPTSFEFVQNTTETTTTTITRYGNATSFQTSQAPDPTSTLPPQPCSTHTLYQSRSSNSLATLTNTGMPTTAAVGTTLPTVTISYVISKRTVTSFVTVPAPSFGAGDSVKSTVNPSTVVHNPTTISLPTSTPQQPLSLEQSTTRDRAGPKIDPTVNPTPVPPRSTRLSDSPSSSAVLVSSIPVVLPGSFVVIGGTTLKPNGGTTAITANGKVFTVNPSQIIAPGTTIARPTANPGAALTGTPTPTVLNGVTVAVGSSAAIIGSSTYKIGPGAHPTTAVIHGQTFSIGPNGVGMGSTTLQPAGSFPTTPPPTHIATLNHVTLTEIGSTLLLGTQTFTLGPGATPTTVVVNGQTFSIGPSGVGSQGTTVFQPQNGGGSNPTQVITAEGVTFSEIGSSVVVLGSSTFTLGAQATPTTEVVNGVTVSIGPGGIGIAGLGGTTVAPPAMQTKAITAGGITFSEIGSSLVVIGSSTFTVGPGATPTTDVYGGVTISVGPGGVGFAGTTVTYGAPTATGAVFVSTSGAGSRDVSRSWFALVLGVLVGVWALL